MLDFDWIVFGLSAVFTFAIVEILFKKLTPDVIPKNLVDFFAEIVWKARGATIAFYAAIAIAKIFLGLI